MQSLRVLDIRQFCPVNNTSYPAAESWRNNQTEFVFDFIKGDQIGFD